MSLNLHYEVPDKPKSFNEWVKICVSKNGGKARMGGSKQGHVSAVILSDARGLFSLTALGIFLMLICIVIPGSGWGRALEKIESVQIRNKS